MSRSGEDRAGPLGESRGTGSRAPAGSPLPPRPAPGARVGDREAQLLPGVDLSLPVDPCSRKFLSRSRLPLSGEPCLTSEALPETRLWGCRPSQQPTGARGPGSVSSGSAPPRPGRPRRGGQGHGATPASHVTCDGTAGRGEHRQQAGRAVPHSCSGCRAWSAPDSSGPLCPARAQQTSSYREAVRRLRVQDTRHTGRCAPSPPPTPRTAVSPHGHSVPTTHGFPAPPPSLSPDLPSPGTSRAHSTWCWSACVWLVSLSTTSPRCIHGGGVGTTFLPKVAYCSSVRRCRLAVGAPRFSLTSSPHGVGVLRGRGLGSRTPHLGAVTGRPNCGVFVPAARTDWGAGVWDILFVHGHVHVRPPSALPGLAMRMRVYPSAGFSERALGLLAGPSGDSVCGGVVPHAPGHTGHCVCGSAAGLCVWIFIPPLCRIHSSVLVCARVHACACDL